MIKKRHAPIYTPKSPAKFFTGTFGLDVKIERSEKLNVRRLVKMRIAIANNIIA